MEIKKLLFAAVISAPIIITAATAMAADEVIFESGRTEAAADYVNLEGWGRELFSRSVFEADVQFKAEGAGIMLRSADDAKDGTTIRAVDRNGKLTLAADGGNGSFIYYIEVDTSAWYHIELFGTYGTNSGMIDMNVGIYDEDMNITETKNYYLILMNDMFASSGVGPEHIRVEPNTVIDNVKVTELRPDAIKLVVPSDTVTAGSQVRLSAKPQRQGEDSDYPTAVKYTVNGDGVYVLDDGLLTIAPDAPEQKFTVKATGEGIEGSAEMSVVSSDIFTINSAVFSEDGSVLEELTAAKNYYYNDLAVFVINVYDDNGTLRDAFVKYVPSKAIPTKTVSPVVMGYTLPKDFDKDAWTMEIYAWGASDICEVPAVSGNTAVRKLFEENGGAVEWIGERRTVVGMLNGKTVVLQIDNNNAYVDGEMITLRSAPFIEDGTTYIPTELADLLK